MRTDDIIQRVIRNQISLPKLEPEKKSLQLLLSVRNDERNLFLVSINMGRLKIICISKPPFYYG